MGLGDAVVSNKPREIGRSVGLAVTAGALVLAVDLNPLLVPIFTIGVRADVAHTYVPRVSFMVWGTSLPKGGTFPPFTPAQMATDGGVTYLRYVTQQIDALAARVQIYIRNDDTVDHTYDVVVHGIG